MRSAVLAAALAMVVTACGSPAEQAVSGPDSISTTAATTTTVAPALTTTGGTVPGERPPDEQSGSGDQAYPEDGFPPEQDEPARLSVEDALLPDDAFGPPWEFQWRQLEAIGYGAGPNQTDCTEYWAYEQLLGGDGGHAMWWIDGGNANHRVIRIEDQGEVLALLLEIGTIAENCPVVNWNEGGSFTTELFTPDVEAFVMRFVDGGSGELTWVAITLLEDLVSVLQIPLWTRADSTMIELTLDDVSVIASEMAQRLQDAGPERTPPRTTIVSTPPTITDPSTSVTPPPLPDPTTTTIVLDELGRLLLTDDELPDGWSVRQVEQYSPGGTDDAFVEQCPAAVSLDLIDEELGWEADFRTLAQREAVQIIGDTGEPGRAVEMIEQFSEVAMCDLSVLIPGAVGSGGPVEIAGADAAGTLFIESPELPENRLELGAAAIGSIVVVFTLDVEFDPAAAGDQMLEFMSLGVTKIDAMGS